MKRAEPLVTGEIYHICNRATEGRDIFGEAVYANYFIDTL